MLRTSPFGAIVGAALLVAAGLPLVASDGAGSTDPGAERARREADRLAGELEQQTDRVDELEGELADAIERLADAWIPLPTSTTAPSRPGAAAQLPSDGLGDTAGSDLSGDRPGQTQGPGATTATSTPAATTPTTEPPVVGTTSTTSVSDDGCPPGYHPMIVVTIPPTAARVCLRDR